MMRLSRWTVAILLGLVGPVLSAEPDVSVATQPTYKKMLDTASNHINDENWKEAAEILTNFLDLDETRWVAVRGAPGLFLSAQRQAANELLRLPRPGREAYRDLYDATAKKMLGDADKEPRLLRQIVARFEATPTGALALRRLADRDDRAERWTHAAAAWGRTLDRDGRKALTIDELVRAVRACRRTGDTAAAAKFWDALKENGEDGVLLLGDRKIKLAELAAEIEKETPLPSTGTHTPIYRGGPRRDSASFDRSVSLASAWQGELTKSKEIKAMLDQGMTALEGERLPVGFGSSPLTVSVARPDGPRDVVIYRSPHGLEALRPADGTVEWKVVDSFSVERLFDNPRTLGRSRNWVQGGWKPLQRSDLLLGNSTLGTLSSDSQQVYAVTDLGLPLYVNALVDREGRPLPGLGELGDWLRHNRLMAINLKSGKLIWEAGGLNKEDTAAESFFLGPPLPLDDHLYVVNQKKNGLRLLVLDARTGKEIGGCALGQAAKPADRHLNRRTTAVHLAYADGVLVCATQAGMVFGIDLVTIRPLWAFSYREESPETAAPAWAGSAPLIADGKVLLAPADDPHLYALDLKTGALKWKQAAPADALYLAGAHRGQVLVACEDSFLGMALDSGRESWRVAVGGVTGLGAMGKDRYYLPVRTTQKGGNPGLAVIDLAERKVKEQMATEKGEMLGNVVFCGDRLISLTPTRLTTYKPGKD